MITVYHFKFTHLFDICYRIKKSVFIHLVGLTDLHIQGNGIVNILSDTFRSMKSLNVLDLSENRLQYLALDALKPIEPQVTSIKMHGCLLKTVKRKRKD